MLPFHTEHSLLYLNRIQPEQDISCYVFTQAGHRVGGANKVALQMLRVPSSRIPWAFPTRLGNVVRAFGHVLPHLDTVLARHTRLPLWTRFATAEEAQRITSHHVDAPDTGVAALAGMASDGGRARLCVCPECFAQDIDQYGYPTWKRLHLMPGMLACHIHQTLLMTFCDACEAGHRRCRSMWRPTLRCVCGNSTKPVADLTEKDTGVAIAIARLAAQVLEGVPATQVTPDIVRSALSRRLGLEPHGSTRATKTLGELLNDRVGEGWVERFAIGKETRYRFTNVNKPHVRNPLQNLLVVHSAFGSWNELADAVVKPGWLPSNGRFEVASFASETRRRKGDRSLRGERYVQRFSELPAEEQDAVTQTHRTWLMQAKAAHQWLARGTAIRLPGGKAAIRHLSTVDSAWYESELPAAAGRTVAAARKMQHTERQAVELAKHIRRRRELALEVHPFRRVSRAYLLNNSRTETARKSVHAMPAVLDALAECVDTQWTHRERVIRMVCSSVRRFCDVSSFGEPKTYVGLEAKSFRNRVGKAKKWLQKFGA